MPLPFSNYVSPGVYTRTIFEPAVNTLIDAVRLPVFIGVGSETLSREDYEMVRGSSSIADTLIAKEDIGSQWVTSLANPQNPTLGTNDGTIRQFQVLHYPIVKGDGRGTTSTAVADVTVLVDDVEVEVSEVKGDLGLVTLRNFPAEDAEVKITYYFHRGDTQFTDDVSDQADSSNKVFKVYNIPIVDGTDGGITTTTTSDVTVKVDGVKVTVSAVDGTTAEITLATAPAAGATVLATYSHNTWQNTFDYLPDSGVTVVTRVGLAPGDASYIEDTDFIVKNQDTGPSLIYWGSSYRVTPQIHTDSSEYFDDTQITTTLVDTKVYLDETDAWTDPTTSVVSTSIFRLTYVPTLGNGRDTTLGTDTFNAIANGRVDLITDRPDLITAYVGVDVVDALKRDPVTVLSVDGANRLITLDTAISPNEKVFATYWTNYLADDTFTLTVIAAGASGSGTYTVDSLLLSAPVYEAKYISKTGVSQTLNWGSGNQQLLGIFHDGSGIPIEEYIKLTLTSQAARGATLSSSVDGPWLITTDNNKFKVNGTTITLTSSTPAVIESSNPSPFDLNSLTFIVYVNDGSAQTFTFEADAMTIADVIEVVNDTAVGVIASFTEDAAATAAVLTGTVDQNFNLIATAATSATVTGTFPQNFDVDTLTLIISMNGGAPQTVTFNADGQTALQVANFINANAAGVIASAPGTSVVLTSNTTGVTSQITIGNGTANGVLGFTNGQTYNGVNQVGKTLIVTVDGGAPQTVTFTSDGQTAAQVATFINDNSTGVTASASGIKVRLTSDTTGVDSVLLLGNGTSNTTLGFTNGQTDAGTEQTGTLVLTTDELGADASIRIGNGTSNSILGFSSGDEETGANTPVATVAADLDAALGASMSIASTSTTVTILTDATGPSATLTIQTVANNCYEALGFEVGQIDQGESSYQTYQVQSYTTSAYDTLTTDGSGTGTIDTGYVGQTYVDEVTGLRISLLPPDEGTLYDDAGVIKFSVLTTFVTDSSNVVYAIPGTEVKVSNTTSIGVGDTATIETMDKAGTEPNIGDTYYITYAYAKTNYDAKVFTKFSDIKAEYGDVLPENRLTLAMYLAIQNGALLVAGKQVKKATGTDDASVADYIDAIDSLRKPIERRFIPAVIQPVTTDTQVIAFTKTHCIVQSSPRYRQERICFYGFAQGTIPTAAQSHAKSLASERMIAVYPDSAVVTLTDELGIDTDYIVDGSFLAAAVAGSNVSPAYDVATPMTFRQIVGFKQLVREMDEVEKNQTAVAGITVLEDMDPNVRIRQAFTTNTSSSLKREPTVITIADHVQQTIRSALSQFIGVKYLGGVLGDIERIVKTTMRGLVQAEIIVGFTNVKALPDETDPTAVQVSLAYSPVLPLNYISVSFLLRAR